MAAADAVSSMRLLKIDEETTANIGSIMADNPTNIVCSHVKMAAEVRSRSKEKLDRQVRHMRDCVENACKKHGAGFRFDTTYPYASFRVEDEAFLGLVRSAYERMGVQCKCGATMVGSDSNILNEKGIVSIVVPTGMTNPHALTEQIDQRCFILRTFKTSGRFRHPGRCVMECNAIKEFRVLDYVFIVAPSAVAGRCCFIRSLG